MNLLLTERKNSYSSFDSSGDGNGDGDEQESSTSGETFYIFSMP